jgi:NADPH:quinone reductase-like Zn-dependent oxidoreductase
MVKGGRLKVELDRAFPLEDAAKAHELLESGGVRGKLVLTV